MSENILQITEVNNLLEIVEVTGGLETTESSTVLTVVESETVSILAIAEQGPRGVQGEPGSGGSGSGSGLTKLEDDTDPHLGGDLTLGGFQFVGSVETDEFVLDGGLLG
jgi:hypothetical protein